jgi:tetratricopeptide (TPR) repeat protein
MVTADVKSTCHRHLSLAAIVALTVALAVGCESKSGSATTAKKSGDQPSASSSKLRSERDDVLFTSVVQQLRNMPSYIDVELTPPSVILDAKTSSDGENVLAICGMAPGVEDGPFNCITSTTMNSRFRSLGVGPGDILKYYVLYDEESEATGISKVVSIDLIVAQVLNDNQLLIEGGLRVPITEPAKIEIWRYSDERLKDIARDIALYVRYRQPVFDWESSPDNRVLKQMTERLNQWMRLSEPKTKWQSDPLVATIDAELAADERLAPLLTAQALANPAIQSHEGRLLQEAVWLRDIARWSQGESFDDLARGAALFDWIVRNIQLDADDKQPPFRPWESLVFGHGTAEQRAWTVALMARQLGLEVVILEVPAGAESSGGKTKFWLPALFTDGKLYLFDTRLGLPILAKDGKSVATLADVQADPALLRQLDLEDAAYPVTAEDLQHVTASAIADPFSLSRRAAAIESKLSGDDRLALATSPTALAEKLKAIPGVTTVKIWDFPFRVIRDQLHIPIAARRELAAEFEPFAWRPQLWKARVLHFQGHKQGDPDAPAADIEEVINDHGDAIVLYTSPAVRPAERVLNTMGTGPKRVIYSRAKDAASYWVGLLLFDDGKLASAADWFSDPKLVSSPDGTWAAGTRYNLGRTYEAQGKTDEAIKLYEADDSPQRTGNRLRALRLKNAASQSGAGESTASTDTAATSETADAPASATPAQ